MIQEESTEVVFVQTKSFMYRWCLFHKILIRYVCLMCCNGYFEFQYIKESRWVLEFKLEIFFSTLKLTMKYLIYNFFYVNNIVWNVYLFLFISMFLSLIETGPASIRREQHEFRTVTVHQYLGVAFWAQGTSACTGYISRHHLKGTIVLLEAGGPKITLSHLARLENEAKDVHCFTATQLSCYYRCKD